MISKKAKYALKRLKFLTGIYRKGPVLFREIAFQEFIPEEFLEIIFLNLRSHGILQSHKGKRGNYQLRVEPNRVGLTRAVRIIDGPIAPASCVSLNLYV